MHTSNTEKMIEQGRTLLDKNRIGEAKTLFTEICKEDEASAEAWLMLGAINGETGTIDEAISCIHRAIELDSGYAEAHFTLAQILNSRGDLNGAAAAARAATEADPGYEEAYQFLGAIHGQLGNFPESEKASRKVIELSPDNANAHANLGNVLARNGNMPDAENSFRQALLINPALASACSGLGNSLVAQRRFEEARSVLEKAIELQPTLIEAHNNLGVLYLSMNDFENALKSFKHLISIAPGCAPAYGNIGNIHMQKGEYQEAVEWFRKAIKLSPQLFEAHLALGNAWRALGARDDARASYKRAATLNPRSLAVLYNLGVIEESLGNLEGALHGYEQASRLDPNNIEALAAIAGIHEKSGDTETAYGIIRPLLDRGIQNVILGTAFSRICRHYDNCDEAIRYLEGLALMPDLANDLRADVHFSLGQLLDRSAQYARAFTHFSQANNAVAVSCNPEEYRHYVDSVIAANSAATLASIPTPATTTKRPVFIVGMPRSGSTLVEQILSAHPQVHGGGETGGIFLLTDKLQAVTGSGQPYPACIADIDQAAADTLADEYRESLDGLNSDALHVTDKMLHNFQNLGLIHALFPEAPLIRVLRNPVDTCLSGYFHRFEGYHPYTFNLENIASHYQEYERLMRHWKDELKLPVLDVRYEALVADPEGVSREIISHCGLQWDDSCSNFHESGRIAATASYDQVRQPVYKRAVGRWKNYRDQIETLLERFPQETEH